MITACYAGSFDPITNGHLDIIVRSLQFCNELIIAIGVNPNKNSMFSEEERTSLILDVPCVKYSEHITVSSFHGLLVDYAKEVKANILVRGIRSVSDFEYEINLANINKVLAPSIETVFLPTSPELAVVSSSMVKEVAKFGGDISKFVPEHIAEAVGSKFGFVKTGEQPSNCPRCQKIDGLKLVDGRPGFWYCRICGWIAGAAK